MRLRSKLSTYFALLTIFVTVMAIVGTYYVVVRPKSNSSQPTASSEPKTIQSEEQLPTTTQEPTPGTIIKTGDSQFGPMLFDGNGQAIYIWELEDSSTAECYGDCAVAWPPVLTNGAPIASENVNNELLGVTKRTDGTTQVTYNNHPLYYYAHEKVGEVKCHNISTHGGLWWVIQPNGTRAN